MLEARVLLPGDHSDESAPQRRLIVLGCVSLGLYAAVAVLSRRFAIAVPSAERPHLAMFALFGVLFAVYLLALRTVGWHRRPLSEWQCGEQRRSLAIVVGFAVAFRLVLLGTTPIQEIDLYRYVWDGNVVACGISPYRFSPQEVREAVVQSGRVGQSGKGAEGGGAGPVHPADDVQQLVRIVQRSPVLAEILRTNHFAELTTPYPPVSQAVFALAALTTPDAASTHIHLVLMKAWIGLFDLLTIVAIIGLLRATRLPPTWCLAYAWCPLVIKEFANSGHLDAIAVCLTTAGLWQLVVWIQRATFESHRNMANGDKPSEPGGFAALSRWLSAATPPVDGPSQEASRQGCQRWGTGWLASLPGCRLLGGVDRRCHSAQPPAKGWQPCRAAVLLGLGIGAKLYPIVLLPVTIAWVLSRQGRRSAVIFGVGVLLVAGITLWPMLAVERDSPSGLTAFLARWQMNDLLFRIVNDNLDPSWPESKEPWFAVVPDDLRMTIVAPVMQRFSVDAGTAAFLLSRCTTLGVFAVIAGWLTWQIANVPRLRPGSEDGPIVTRTACPAEAVPENVEASSSARQAVARQHHPTLAHAQQKTRHLEHAGSRRFLEAAFLTLTWFWLLAPTQNPWYWTWCLPLLPFARSRMWLWVAGLTMTYYLRFWFNAHWPEPPGPLHGLGGSWNGASFFDVVVVWCEFVPLFAGLFVGWLIGRRQQ